MTSDVSSERRPESADNYVVFLFFVFFLNVIMTTGYQLYIMNSSMETRKHAFRFFKSVFVFVHRAVVDVSEAG